jgi:magnesium chelatase family protein
MYVNSAAPEGSAVVAARIAASRRRQVCRNGRPNSGLSGRALRAACALGPVEQAHAIRLAELEGWSARGIERLLRVARTAADLASCDVVDGSHLDEAERFRSPSCWRAGFQAAS